MALKKPFEIASGRAESKKNLFLEIEGIAYGEASGSIYYGPDSKTVYKNLQQAVSILASCDNLSLAGLSDLNKLDLDAVTKSALIAAGLNYISQRQNKYPWQILNLPAPERVATSYTIGIDTVPAMLDQIKNSPYPILKIKMGFDGDEILPGEMKKIPGRLFRVDANGGWSLEKAERMLHQLDRIGVVLVEQPTTVENIREWPHLKHGGKVKLFIDEGLTDIDDYNRFGEYVDGINIKMAKSGGVLDAIELARAAHRDHIGVMLGCMVESSIAVSQGVYMASLADYFDLDGPLLLAHDPAIGLKYEIEKIILNEDIMGGPKLKPEYRKNES